MPVLVLADLGNESGPSRHHVPQVHPQANDAHIPLLQNN